MTIHEFIQRYDFDGSVVLLEGKRAVRDIDKERLFELGRLLASKSNHLLFRSGNADGADSCFSAGVSCINQNRLQIIVPYTGHRQKSMHTYDAITLDSINLAAESEVVYHAMQNKKHYRIIEQYLAGEINRNSIKAAYLIRDTIKVVGTSSINSASFGIFYDDLQNPKAGGTGHTMLICEQNNIPIIDQSVWFSWLNTY